jgi:hypothetical protein
MAPLGPLLFAEQDELEQLVSYLSSSLLDAFFDGLSSTGRGK